MNRDISIVKRGCIDLDIVESNPIVFKGQIYRFEYIRFFSQEKRYHKSNMETSYFRFVNVSTGEILLPFAHDLHMGNAFVWQERVYVTAVENWGKSRFYQLESDDLIHWSTPMVILEGQSWEGYNTTVCWAGNRFVLAFELGAPLEIVKVPFTMFFAESIDLRKWKLIPETVFLRDVYTGGPMLRYFNGWFYMFYLNGSYENGFEEYVARSNDLKNWNLSPRNPVLSYDDKDRTLRGKFTLEESEKIRTAENINVSDLDMCEWQNKLYMVYSWGNQKGTEFLAEAEAACNEQEFCESFF